MNTDSTDSADLHGFFCALSVKSVKSVFNYLKFMTLSKIKGGKTFDEIIKNGNKCEMPAGLCCHWLCVLLAESPKAGRAHDQKACLTEAQGAQREAKEGFLCVLCASVRIWVLML